MHLTSPLPHADLTGSQRQLLAQVASAPLPDPDDGTNSAEAVVAHGLDPDQVRADLPSLTWLKLITRTHGSLVATDLGTAVHFHALYESSEERLSQVAQLVSAHQTRAPELARCVRRLAEGSLTFEEAAIRLRDSG